MKYERFLLGLNKNGETVQYCVDLKQLNSFGIGGKTKYLVVANKAKTIKEIAKYTKLFYIVGNGTNIVFPDKLYKGTIIKLGKNFSTIKLLPLIVSVCQEYGHDLDGSSDLSYWPKGLR